MRTLSARLGNRNRCDSDLAKTQYGMAAGCVADGNCWCSRGIAGAEKARSTVATAAPAPTRTSVQTNAAGARSARPCRGLVAAQQGLAPARARASVAERSELPTPVSTAATAAYSGVASVLQPASRAAIAHAQPHGDLGAPYPGPETASTPDLRRDASITAGS